MYYCINCGSGLEFLESGHGCGGQGNMYGCKVCDIVLRQDSGGMIPESVTLKKLPHMTLAEYKARKAQEAKPSES